MTVGQTVSAVGKLTDRQTNGLGDLLYRSRNELYKLLLCHFCYAYISAN